MTRRQRVDSSTAAVKIMAGAIREILPPAHIRMDAGDMPYWQSVIGEFARAEWSAHQLELAALLARTMADLEREQYELRTEGSVMSSERGTPVTNPRRQAVQMHTGSILSLRRSLSLHARAQKGEARDVSKRAGMSKAIEADLDDDLLARPEAIN
jgi:hypothetical protein